MKFLITCLLLSLSMYYLCSPTDRNHPDGWSECARIENEVIRETLNSYPGIYVTATGGGSLLGVERLSLHLKTEKSLSIREIRKIVIGTANRFLHALDSSKEIRPYLVEYPFPVREITIFINIYPQAGDNPTSKGRLSNGMFYVEVEDTKLAKETFKEANQILEKEALDEIDNKWEEK
ncbi:MAG: hypothetical protein JSR46_07445 [Verrucomicrobia bacterium]|nr:hypothetical protein [Verrucomicrobiota bacterium]